MKKRALPWEKDSTHKKGEKYRLTKAPPTDSGAEKKMLVKLKKKKRQIPERDTSKCNRERGKETGGRIA